jgi:hypothetical protein
MQVSAITMIAMASFFAPVLLMVSPLVIKAYGQQLSFLAMQKMYSKISRSVQ